LGQNVATRAHLSPIKCTKSFGGRGFAPDPTGGAYSAPPDPLAGFRGRRFAARGGGREGREGKAQGAPLRGAGRGRGREGKGGREGERGREGRGEAPPLQNPFRRHCITRHLATNINHTLEL
jgi:hypothetical protein